MPNLYPTKAALAVALVLALVVPAGPIQAAPLEIKTPSAILLDAASGKVLFEQNADQRVFPASTTKIMTLVVALEAVHAGRTSMDAPATATPYACSFGGTQVYASPGETFPLRDWITAVGVGSANDGSMVVAEHIAGSEEKFVEMMNQKAKELGMTGTNFMNPHGLHHDNHYTTARDLAILGRYATTVPELLDYTGIYRTTFRHGTFGLDNFNKLVRTYDGCDGLKTGHTSQSGYCLVATAKRDGSRFVAVAMGATDATTRNNDVVKMLNYAFANYRSIPVATKGQVVGLARVYKGVQEDVEVIAPTDFGVTVEKGKYSGIKKDVIINPVVAPVEKGQVLGEIVLSREGEELARLQLVAAQAVPRSGFFRMWGVITRAFLAGR
ncbi:MAG: D-alanyl-D-alanine carboxypeptidase family protein [Bacillota bacterium]